MTRPEHTTSDTRATVQARIEQRIKHSNILQRIAAGVGLLGTAAFMWGALEENSVAATSGTGVVVASAVGATQNRRLTYQRCARNVKAYEEQVCQAFEASGGMALYETRKGAAERFPINKKTDNAWMVTFTPWLGSVIVEGGIIGNSGETMSSSVLPAAATAVAGVALGMAYGFYSFDMEAAAANAQNYTARLNAIDGLV